MQSSSSAAQGDMRIRKPRRADRLGLRLARAYGGSAAECLRLAAKSAIIVRVAVVVRCDFPAAAALRARLGEYDAEKTHERPEGDGVELEIELPAEHVAALTDLVRNLTRGRGRLIAPEDRG
jgi:putative IMPACT (imprinted ancient) family translation regulator